MKIIDSVLLWYTYIRFEILQSPVPVLILSLKFEHLTLPYAFIFLLLFTLYPLIHYIQFCSGLSGHDNFIISNFSCFYFFQNFSLYILENFKRINYLFTFISLFTIFIILLYFYYLFIVHYQSSLKFFYFCKQFFC